MSIECEKSFIFTHEGLDGFLSDNKLTALHPYITIDDYYLDKNTRIRQISDCYCKSIATYVTQKTGDKSSGSRVEKESEISSEAAFSLRDVSKLQVHKTRRNIEGHDGVTVDYVQSPMKLAVLEIEQSTPEKLKEHPFLKYTENLRECPLSAWDFFRRKIGICGAPSCGKSETAKILSHKLNTEFGANSYYVAEYATSFIQKYNRLPQFADQFFIWHGQHEREKNASRANIVVSDCPTFLSYIYMLILNKQEFSEQLALYVSKIYKRALFDTTSYTDLIFLQLKNYQQNNVRYQTFQEALEIEKRIERFLDDHKIKHVIGTYNDTDKFLKDMFYIN